MLEEVELIKSEIGRVVPVFLEKVKNKEVLVVSHFDTDGITSAAIMVKALKRLNVIFSVKIVKSLNEDFIMNLPQDRVILFLDLGSSSLHAIVRAGLSDVFVIDHHDLVDVIPDTVFVINPEVINKQKISASGLSYLFAKEMSKENSNLIKLAIIGMIGDRLERELSIFEADIKASSDVKLMSGLLLYPVTRPINLTLEYSSQPYLEGITANPKNIAMLLKRVGITPANGVYKSIVDLTDSESDLLLKEFLDKNPSVKKKDIYGDIYLVKIFKIFDDAREISAKINACSRAGSPEVAIQYVLNVEGVKKDAESVHVKHKQALMQAIKYAKETKKIQGIGFEVMNARDNIPETMIGTIASIISNSSDTPRGKIIVTMANYEDKIKISARVAGRTGKNVLGVLKRVIGKIEGGDVGGHEFAAGGVINQSDEDEFIIGLKEEVEAFATPEEVEGFKVWQKNEQVKNASLVAKDEVLSEEEFSEASVQATL